jgi:hypothetical protein
MMKMISNVQREISKIQNLSADELFDDPVFKQDKPDDTAMNKVFEYKMKHERN